MNWILTNNKFFRLRKWSINQIYISFFVGISIDIIHSSIKNSDSILWFQIIYSAWNFQSLWQIWGCYTHVFFASLMNSTLYCQKKGVCRAWRFIIIFLVHVYMKSFFFYTKTKNNVEKKKRKKDEKYIIVMKKRKRNSNSFYS